MEIECRQHKDRIMKLERDLELLVRGIRGVEDAIVFGADLDLDLVLITLRNLLDDYPLPIELDPEAVPIILSDTEFDKLTSLVMNPPAPTEALKEATLKFKYCAECNNTKKILEDHDGRAGYRACPHCR